MYFELLLVSCRLLEPIFRGHSIKHFCREFWKWVWVWILTFSILFTNGCVILKFLTLFEIYFPNHFVKSYGDLIFGEKWWIIYNLLWGDSPICIRYDLEQNLVFVSNDVFHSCSKCSRPLVSQIHRFYQRNLHPWYIAFSTEMVKRNNFFLRWW